LCRWAAVHRSGGQGKKIATRQSGKTTKKTTKPLRMNSDTILKDIRNHIARDELAQALQQLRQFLGNAPQLDGALRQELRALWGEIEPQARENPALKEELEGALSVLRSKNIVASASITAAGDVHIGDKHVVIQSVSDSTLTLYVDGQLRQVERKLDALMALLQKLQVNSVQTADKIINIGNINSANFEVIVGQSALNLSLPSELAHNLAAGDDRWVESLRQELMKQSGVSVRNRPTEVFKHYGWLIEAFLQKMGTPAGRERKPRRLAFMAEAYQSTLRYLCSIQVSQVFQQSPPSPNPAIAEFIALDPQAHSHYDYLNLLLVSTGWIGRGDAFVPEIHDFVQELQDPRTDLHGAALFLEKHRRELLAGKAPQGEALEPLLDEYLTALVFWLRKLAFLSQYRMVSIKEIRLSYRLGTAKYFVHLYGELHGMYDETISDGEDYSEQAIEDVCTYNQSVLLFRGPSMDYCFQYINVPSSYISLSPLIVDQSVYSNKATQTPEIFYFTGLDSARRQYCFAEYRNELDGQGKPVRSNKQLSVKAQNMKYSLLDELYGQLQKVFQPFKSPAR
jgi:hypothetical protein